MSTNFFYSPLEQFEIFPLFGWWFAFEVSPLSGAMTFLLSNSDIIFFVGLFELFFILWLVSNSQVLTYRNVITLRFGQLVSQLLRLLLDRVGKSGQVHLGVVLTLGIFIILFNLLGLVPFGFCVTAHVIVTQFLAVFAFSGLTLKGIQNLGFMWFNLFITRNVPFIMVPFLSIIEFVSYFSRVFSLSIRLFANMVAGHALLHILIGGLLGLFGLGIPSVLAIVFAGLPTLLIFAIAALELGVAFLQGYVFVVLYLVYLSDALFSH